MMRQCLNCCLEFLPSKFNRRQKYCSERCEYKINNKKYWSRIDNRIYRYKSECLVCKNFRRTSLQNVCESCKNKAAFGKAKKPIVGRCNVCFRDGLTLSGSKCKSCAVYGKFVGVQKFSHNEILLFELVKQQYVHEPIVRHYRPFWLVKPGSKSPMEIDVALPNLKLGFEFDGRPHLDPKHPGYISSNINDTWKMKLCSKNSWTLIKIRTDVVLRSVGNFSHFLNGLDDLFDGDGSYNSYDICDLVGSHKVLVTFPKENHETKQI